MKKKYISLFLGISALGLLLGTGVHALPPGFHVYFNDAPHSNPNGIDTAMVEFINSANVSVEGAFYSIIRSRIVDAIIEASNRLGNENVRIITDASNRGDAGARRLETAGIQLIDETCDGWGASAFESHNKFCIVDGQKIWTGSYNITDTCSIYNNNNAVVIECPELAQAFLAEFNEMWGSESGAPGDCHFSTNKTTQVDHSITCNGVLVEAYFSPTKESAPNRALDAILNLFDQAQNSIHFCIFTFTSEDIATSIIDAHKAGLTVQGVMDDDQAESSYSQYFSMKTKGVDVKKDSEVTPHGAYLHHKFAVVDYGTDQAKVLTGSYNWTSAAQFKNDENTLIIHDREVADLYYQQFQTCFYGESSATPTPSPTPPSSDPMITISCNQSVYNAGNYMRVWTNISNQSEFRTLDEYIVLDLGEPFGANRFYFWPNWTQQVNYQRMFLSEGTADEQELFSFILPSPLGQAGPFAFYAAFINPSTGQLACDYDFIQFSFE